MAGSIGTSVPGTVVTTTSTTINSFDARGIQTLFGPGAPPSMSHTDAKYKNGTTKQCRASWKNVANRTVAKRHIEPAKVEQLRQKAVASGINEKYVRRSIASFLANQDRLPNQRYVTFIDFNQRSDAKRMVVMDLEDYSFKTYHVAAGSGSDKKGNGYATRFSNKEGTHASSLGCYVANGEFNDGKGRPALLFHGIESTNDNACQRAVFMHTAGYVGGVPGRSWGCPAVRPQDRNQIYKKLGGGGLICSYYDGKQEVASAASPGTQRKGRKGRRGSRRG